MNRFGWLSVIVVSACMSAGGCGWNYQIVEVAVIDNQRGIPAAGARVCVSDSQFTIRPYRVVGVTDEDGRVKLVLVDRGARLHVHSITDHSKFVIQGYKPWLWKSYLAGTKFEVEATVVREGGTLPYDPGLNQDRPLAKHIVTLTPAPPASSLGRLMLRMGIIPLAMIDIAEEAVTPAPSLALHSGSPPLP